MNQSRYYASIVTELDIPKASLNGEKIGMDLGLKDFVITSKPEKFPNPRYFQRSLRRLKIRQRRLSRKVKGSNNRQKARIRVATINEKVANQRLDYQQKISLKLTGNKAISWEDLNIKKRLNFQGKYRPLRLIVFDKNLTSVSFYNHLTKC